MVFVSFQEAADRQGKYILPGNLTRFFNTSAIYNFDFTELNLNLNLGLNLSCNYSDRKNLLTMGPTASVMWRLLNKQMTTAVTISMNKTREEERAISDVYNCRWSINYRFLKKHGLQGSLLFQKKDLMNNEKNKDAKSLITTISYFYNF